MAAIFAWNIRDNCILPPGALPRLAPLPFPSVRSSLRRTAASRRPTLLHSLVMPLTSLLIAAAAYLFGSIPIGYLLVRLFRHQDIRAVGSGIIGASNVLRAGGKGLGAVTFLLDMLKGCVAVWLGALGWTLLIRGASMAPAVPLRDFEALAAIAGFVLGRALSRYVSLASILGSASCPVFAWFLVSGARPAFFTAVEIAVALLVILKHHQNIRRLLAGTESRFGAKQLA